MKSLSKVLLAESTASSVDAKAETDATRAEFYRGRAAAFADAAKLAEIAEAGAS